MKPTAKNTGPKNPLAEVALDGTDDKALKQMREDLLDLFEQKSRKFRSSGLSNEEAAMMIDAASGFAAVVSEQRERAVIRAAKAVNKP